MAGRIPQSFIDDLLERTDLVELIDSRVKLKKSGRSYTACCPFHEEKTPSFSVNPDRQFYYCFGCGASGNAISFLMDYDRTDFVDSIDELAKRHGITVPREDDPLRQGEQKSRRSIHDLLEQSATYYQQQLYHHSDKKKVHAYLKQRGLSQEVVNTFGIGFAPSGWDNLLKQLGHNPEQIKLLLEAGMLVEKEGQAGFYDRFRDRLMFPIRDNRGRTIAFGGRVFNDDKPKYLNSPETPLFHKQQELYGLYEARQANRHLERLIMVEGYMDVVALAQFGITNAVATLGTSAGTPHMEKVFRHTNEVVFCFDGDNAGRKAADRALEAVLPLMEGGRQARFLFLPEGEDPDSLVRKMGKDRFIQQVEQALALSEYLFSKHAQGLNLRRADDKARLISNIMPSIRQLPAGTFRELLLRSLAEQTSLPIEELKALELDESASPPQAITREEGQERQRQTPPRRRERLPPSSRQVKRTAVKTATALLILAPELAGIEFPLEELDASDPDTALMLELLAFIRETPDTNSARIIGYWQSHNKVAIHQLFSLELLAETPEQQKAEYCDAIERMRQKQRHRQQASLIESLKQSPNIRIEEMSEEDRAAYLAIFRKK